VIRHENATFLSGLSPEFTEMRNESDIRKIRFDSGTLPDILQSISLVIKCGTRECVTRIDGFDEVGYRQTELGTATVIIRVTPVDDTWAIGFDVNGTNIPVDVLYTCDVITPERARLRLALGPHAQQFAKERFLSDTVRLFTRVI
jgi:hypothetical protein